MKHLFKMNPYGMDGFGGPNYLGSNTFLARRALFDSSLESESGRNLLEPEKVLEMATEAAACNYETGTKWGKTVLFFLPHYLLLLHKLSIKILYLHSYFEIICILLFWKM